MKKYIISIGCALCAQVIHAEESSYDRMQREDEQREQQRSIERIERQIDRIEQRYEDREWQHNLDRWARTIE